MILYLDSSALVKLYVPEVSSDETQQLLLQARTVATSRIAYVEVCSALARRRKERSLQEKEYKEAVQEFAKQWPAFGAGDLDEFKAGELALKHGLRGFDAVHLATALEVRAAAGTTPFLFCSFDAQQIAAARAEKLQVAPVRH